MSRSLLLFLGAVALGGGVFYLYKSGKLVATPGAMAQGSPTQAFRRVERVAMKPLNIPVSGYSW